jgi:hypothetical protein
MREAQVVSSVRGRPPGGSRLALSCSQPGRSGRRPHARAAERVAGASTTATAAAASVMQERASGLVMACSAPCAAGHQRAAGRASGAPCGDDDADISAGTSVAAPCSIGSTAASRGAGRRREARCRRPSAGSYGRWPSRRAAALAEGGRRRTGCSAGCAERTSRARDRRGQGTQWSCPAGRRPPARARRAGATASGRPPGLGSRADRSGGRAGALSVFCSSRASRGWRCVGRRTG